MKKVLPYINAVFSLFLTIGTKFIFHACGPKDDGSYMTCHYAQNTIVAVSIVITVIAVLAALLKDEKIKTGLTVAIIPTALLEIFIPNVVIPMCMMDTMRCQSIMRPAVVALSIIIIVLAAVTTALNLKKSK